MSRIFCMLGLALLAAGHGDVPSHFRYERSVSSSSIGTSCAVLDPLIFAHAAESLSDLRLLSAGGAEVPYVVTVSGTAGESVTVPVRNLIRHGSALAFDLEMPARPYTDVVLDIASTDFVATAAVSGWSAASPDVTQLGEFAVFDLSASQLPRSTVLHLQETTLPMLHVELRAAPGSNALRPEMVAGAVVPPAREAQTLYTTAVRASDVIQHGQETVVRLNVPARVPIQRVLVALAPGFRGDFNRVVRIEAHRIGGSTTNADAGEAETLAGVIAQLHLTRDGILLTADRMTVPATLGANLQTAAAVEVAIENSDRWPLPVRSVELQTRERRLCFNNPTAAEPLMLFYGDPHLHAPGYAAVPRLTADAVVYTAALGAEQQNSSFAEQADQRPILRRHPRLFTLGFVLLVCFAGVIALRSAKLRL